MSDEKGKGVRKSKPEKAGAGEWSQEDMENAEPLPTPEIDDEESDKKG